MPLSNEATRVLTEPMPDDDAVDGGMGAVVTVVACAVFAGVACCGLIHECRDADDDVDDGGASLTLLSPLVAVLMMIVLPATGVCEEGLAGGGSAGLANACVRAFTVDDVVVVAEDDVADVGAAVAL